MKNIIIPETKNLDSSRILHFTFTKILVIKNYSDNVRLYVLSKQTLIPSTSSLAPIAFAPLATSYTAT